VTAPHVCLPCRLGFANRNLWAEHIRTAHTEQPVGPLVFELPLPPNLANARWHWSERAVRQRAYRVACDAAAGLPAPPSMPLAHARADVVLRSLRMMDADNLESRCKWIWDWLCARGYLRDDSPQVLTLAPVLQERCKRSAVGVRLVLTPEAV